MSLVYVALERGTQQLFLRPLDSNDAKPIAGTEGASGPSFSPDGQWIAFFASGKLKKISVNGGAAMTLANAVNPGGVSWSRYGTLGFQGITISSQVLQQVNQTGGGPPQPLTHITKTGGFQRWPDFLPDSQAVLFASSGIQAVWNNAQILVQRVGTSEQTSLTQGGTQPRYSPTGHLLYTQGGTLMAAPFDTRKLALMAGPVPVLENVLQWTTTGAAQYSVSATGTLVYLAGGIAGGQIKLVWVSRRGQEEVLPAAPRNYSYPRLSPDGRRVIVSIAEQDTQLWIYDLSRDNTTRLTFEGTTNLNSVWSPDGQQIAFMSNRTGQPEIFWQSANGNGRPEQLTKNGYTTSPASFSPNGQLLAFIKNDPETSRDIWVLNLKNRRPQLFLKTPYEETAPRFSPDGKWMAYSSDETGHREIYVQPYPGTGAKWQISIDGGQEPVWNPRGGELFYRSGSKIMAVDIDARSTFSASKPRMLFEGPYLQTLGSFPFYDVSPDGQRFLMLKPVEAPTNAPTQINC
jgi:serine/threonine-protein kinase